MIDIPDEMKKNYLQRRAADLVTLTEALKIKSIQEFHKIGHQIKGNARSFGFEDLEAIGIEMDHLQENEYDQKAARLVSDLKNWIDNTKI